MGIAITNLENLLYLKSQIKDGFYGKILQLGRQDTYFDYSTFLEACKNFQINPQIVAVESLLNPYTKALTISDKTLFESLGFSHVESLDLVNNEGATYECDLSEPIPDMLTQVFDFIYDGGTLEHVFDTASFFKNVHNLLKPGGFIIHDTPTNNYVDHGFWQVSPTTFVDTYLKNGYKIYSIFVSVHDDSSALHKRPRKRIAYNPPVFAAYSIGGFSEGIYTTFFAAQKPLTHIEFQKPIQGFYSKHWNLGTQ